MNGHFIVNGVLILSLAAALGGVSSSAQPKHSLNPFPAHVLTALALQKDEAPPGYALITSTNHLAQVGIATNPGYQTRRADLEDIIQMGGAAAFLALYGPEESVRLMVKGVFFWNPEQAEKYAEVQSTRHRLVMAYRLDTTGGIWLLFIACDPDLTYDEKELRLITRGLKAYQRRLTLSPLFDQMNNGHAE
jgi:hypothetical protein